MLVKWKRQLMKDLLGKVDMIPKSCLDKQGSGTIVGICDTGINIDLSYFEGKKVLFKDFGTSSPHHGTNMASTIFDISPKCEMIFAGGLLDSYGRMLRMLEWLSTFELDVLNLSLAIDEPDDEILKTLHKIQNRGTLIVCSYSNKRPFLCQKEFISAGKGGDFEAPEERISMSSTGYLSSMKGEE